MINEVNKLFAEQVEKLEAIDETLVSNINVLTEKFNSELADLKNQREHVRSGLLLVKRFKPIQSSTSETE